MAHESEHSTTKQASTLRAALGALTAGVRELYQSGQSDYALKPLVLTDQQGHPVAPIGSGDAVIFCCRRGEREVQLTEAFVEAEFAHFPRRALDDLLFVPLTLYHEKLRQIPVAFGPTALKDTLGEVVSSQGLAQCHIAESEKFAHVTFFFNGGTNQPFPGERDVQVPSPRGVPFQQVPELSARGVTEAALDAMRLGTAFIVVNFANGDVIGHLADREAKLAAARAVDTSLGQLLEGAMAAGYATMITADHGALELLTKADGTPNVAHTTNLVPFAAVAAGLSSTISVRAGKLADVAPTVLAAMGLPQPAAMSGQSLLPSGLWAKRQRVALIILDGWGLGSEDENNPIHIAETPHWDRVRREHPFGRLAASGEAVGLGRGKAGNSEAGHNNIGAGRVVAQDDVRLEMAMRDGSFEQNEVFLRAMEHVRSKGSALHLLALLSERSSHGTVEYPLALLRLAKKQGLQRVYVHAILDGRSTEPGSAPALLASLAERMAEIGLGQIVSAVGRGYALSRDRDYEKTRLAYEAFVEGKGKACPLQAEAC